MKLTNKENEVLSNALRTRYETSKKFRADEFAVGDLVLTKWVSKLDPEHPVETFSILVVARKNKDNLRLASINEHGKVVVAEYLVKPSDLVVPLMSWEASDNRGTEND
jgi:hypothetical protein